MRTSNGNLIKPEIVAEIQPGTSTRADVQAKWGPPSTVSAFDPSVWYYIGEKRARKGVFAPKIEQRDIIKVTFNDDDTVKDVVRSDKSSGKQIAISTDKTPTAGKEFTAFQQFVGNLGKFNGGEAGAGRRSSPGAR